jgi:hypothetical protein
MKFVITILTLLIALQMPGQMKVDHYYVYAKEKVGEGFKYEYGKYSLSATSLDIDTSYTEFNGVINEIGKKSYKGIIFYIHGFSADNRMHEKEQGRLLHNEFYSQLSNQYDLVVSLKWSPEKDYPATYPSAIAKGNNLYPYADSIIQLVRKDNPTCPVTFIMHSMGNRIFENLYLAKEKANTKWNLHQVLMCAPDIENDVFFTSLKGLPQDCKEVHYLYNIDDRTLGVAKAMKPYERLGIVGHKEADKLPANVYKIDTTGTKDNEGWFAQMSLHRYWYASPSIRDVVRKILRGW